MPTPMNRLTPDDDLFRRVDRLFGSVIVNQFALLFDRPVDRAVVQAFHAHLAAGFLARRVVTSRIPLARPWWQPAHASIPLVWQQDRVEDSSLVDWLADQAEVEFDPATGRLWRLSVAPYGTGHVLSLVISHIAADGSGAVGAIGDALARVAAELPVSRADSSGALVGDAPENGVWRRNLADAAGQLRAIGTGIVRAFRARGITEPPRPTRPDDLVVPLGERYHPAEVILNIPLAQWEKAAAAHGGTANGLMLGAALGVLGRSGRIRDGDLARIEIPRSLRVPGDPRGNATTGIPISVPYRKGELADLGAIRSATKAAITAYDDPDRVPPLQHLQPLQMVIPDAVARKLARTSKAPLCLCTNLGGAAGPLLNLGANRARAVLLRPMLKEAETELYRRTEAGLNMSWCSDGDQVFLAVTAADPDHFPSREVLRGFVEEEFAAWGLHPAFW
ncbi:hypothetical protein [Nocardia brasiliensis]|uniref:hypothetical protein n=1 Tax=Nocardia brasiliensis TaxID=37326 RepID=UPI0033FA0562